MKWLKALRGADAKPRIEPTIGNLTEFHDVSSSDLVKMGQIFGGYPTSSGAIVTESTSMRVAAVYACVSLIAGSIATLPWHVYRRTTNGRERADHAYWWLFNEQPCATFSAHTFWRFVVTQILLRGDGLAWLQRNKLGEVVAVHPLKRSQVSIKRDRGRLVYHISDDDKDLTPEGRQYFGADQEDILHFTGEGFDGISSMSVIQWGARQGIGIAIAADDFAATFFGNGAHPQFAVKTPAGATMTEEQQKLFREAWIAKYGGGKGVSDIPLILTEGLDVTQLSLSADDAQLLESRKWQTEDIARAFGVPPFMIGYTEKSTSWGSGVEQMGIGFVRYSLMPRLASIAQELNRKLWPRGTTYYLEPNVDALMEGDSKAQAEYLAKALGGPGAQGWMKVNEVRRLKNLPPIEGGDEVIKAGSEPAKPETADADS
jgi:HK97 family phage portal protein